MRSSPKTASGCDHTGCGWLGGTSNQVASIRPKSTGRVDLAQEFVRQIAGDGRRASEHIDLARDEGIDKRLQLVQVIDDDVFDILAQGVDG